MSLKLFAIIHEFFVSCDETYFEWYRMSLNCNLKITCLFPLNIILYIYLRGTFSLKVISYKSIFNYDFDSDQFSDIAVSLLTDKNFSLSL